MAEIAIATPGGDVADMPSPIVCHVCKSKAVPHGRATVLGKYEIQYFSCRNCGFIQTETPYWLDEAYSSTIARSDIGLIGRNIKAASVVGAMIGAFFSRKGAFLDYGGGNGMLVRLLRDRGLDFYWYDKYTVNQFAIGFEATAPSGYELATAFEVLEHLEDPLSGIEEILGFTDSILCSTLLVPRNMPLPQDWWYYALDTGQHISLYSHRALAEIARLFDLRLYSNGRSIHLLTKRRLFAPAYLPLSLAPVARLLAPPLLLGLRSRLDADYFLVTGRHLS